MKKSIFKTIFITSLILTLSSCNVWWKTPYDPSYYNDPLMPPPVVNPMPSGPKSPHNDPENKLNHKPDGGNHKPDNKPNVKPNTPENKPGISPDSSPDANNGIRPGAGTRSGNRRH